MKSPMIQSTTYIDEKEKSNYSDLQVLKSGAGYYVGTVYNDPEGFQEPGSRDTGYFATEAEAEAALELIKQDMMVTRMTP